MNGYDILTARQVTRLCHFTKLQKLTHIITSEDGILASDSIQQDIKQANDSARYDGELNFVCCSVQYPNSWFLKKVMQKNLDEIFRDWVVLYINIGVLNYKNAKFSPGNASKANGAYINENMTDIDSIFAPSVPTFSYPRSPEMLSCCPTDGQAEILIENNIPREYINGIAVSNRDVAARVAAMLKTTGMNHINIYIAPEVLTTKWSYIVKKGCIPNEFRYNWSEED